MKLVHRRASSFDLGMWSIISFVALTTLAIVIYPGGTNVDASTYGYQFAGNFFSDLGRYHTFSGETKLASMVLFILAATGASIGILAYFATAPKLFEGNERILANIGSIPGFVSGISFMGVGFTPWDLWGQEHLLLVKTAFTAFLIAAFFYMVVSFRSSQVANKYGWIFFSHIFILSGYLYLLFFGPSSKTPEGLFIQVVGQKVVVFSQIFCVFMQLVAARELYAKKLYSIQSVEPGLQQATSNG